jgi:hypothetical protein
VAPLIGAALAVLVYKAADIKSMIDVFNPKTS